MTGLARYGLTAKAPTLKRMEVTRQAATLLATLRHLETATVDDALDLLHVLMAIKLLAKGHLRHAGQDRRIPPHDGAGARRARHARPWCHRTARAWANPRVSAEPAVNGRLLARCQPLDNAAAIPAQRKARREYENRVSALISTGP